MKNASVKIKYSLQEVGECPALRLEFYKKLLKVVCKDPDVNQGYCYYIKLLTGHVMVFYSTFGDNLPELYKYRPIEFFLFWFPRTNRGWQKRINILVKVISKMEKTLKHEHKRI